ncbi:MAG TPA: hypothetical protein VK489_07875, partial [Ferruginibacter sp.]|nr:hypothetical protein [Ferruginibacter sp.]
MKKIMLLAIPAMISFANAQVGITNSGNLQVHAGGSFTGFEHFSNSATAVLVNNGTVFLRSNITNAQAGMSAGAGILHLNGTTPQAVNGTQPFKAFNLITNNASGITLNNNLSVGGTHTYSNGMITTSSTPNYMIYEAGSSYTGSNDARHVNGWVKKNGNTNFTFPVGNATYERSVALTNLTAASEFNVRYNPAPTPNHMSVYNPLVLVDTFEYWTINKISGSAAQVTINWNTGKVPFPNFMLSGIRAAWYDGTFWRGIGGTASGTVATSGSVTSNSVSVFNTRFVIGSVSWLLPLRIISFNGERISDHAKVNWVIGNEFNVDHYELARSDDGLVFYTVSAQSPINRNGTELYSHEDHKTFNNIVYYRLKITDGSSQVSYSHIITFSANNSGKELYVVTNPVSASIEVYAGSSVKGTYNYTIANSSGL